MFSVRVDVYVYVRTCLGSGVVLWRPLSLTWPLFVICSSHSALWDIWKSLIERFETDLAVFKSV